MPKKNDTMTQRDRLWAGLTLGTILLTIGINYLVGASTVIGPTNAEISARYPTLLTPAGYAFSIWGLIYIGLVAFGVYQLLPAQLGNPRFRRIRPYVVLNALLNCAWIFAFTFERIILSTGIILGLLLTLILIHRGLEIGRTYVPRVETWTTRGPFSIYFGWLTLATIINVAIALLSVGWDGGGVASETWALLLVAVGLAIGLIIHARFRNGWYLITLAWGFGGIAVGQSGVLLVHGGALMAALAALLTVVISPIHAPRPVRLEEEEAKKEKIPKVGIRDETG
jgi:hypothetical protein